MHDAVRNKQRSMSANMKTLKIKSWINLRKQVLGLNYLDKELFLNHKQFSVAELLTHFENLRQL